jgi:hypothetical protein
MGVFGESVGDVSAAERGVKVADPGGEIRNPKSEIRKKSEARNPKSERIPRLRWGIAWDENHHRGTETQSGREKASVPLCLCGEYFRGNPDSENRNQAPCSIRISDFGFLSDFGLRISDLALIAKTGC